MSRLGELLVGLYRAYTTYTLDAGIGQLTDRRRAGSFERTRRKHRRRRHVVAALVLEPLFYQPHVAGVVVLDVGRAHAHH